MSETTTEPRAGAYVELTPELKVEFQTRIIQARLNISAVLRSTIQKLTELDAGELRFFVERIDSARFSNAIRLTREKEKALDQVKRAKYG